VIPVHLNELSADAARGLIPGLAYQLGILFVSPTNSMQYALRARVGYQWAIAGFEMAAKVSPIYSLYIVLPGLCGGPLTIRNKAA
jgi:hypothetical protein